MKAKSKTLQDIYRSRVRHLQHLCKASTTNRQDTESEDTSVGKDKRCDKNSRCRAKIFISAQHLEAILPTYAGREFYVQIFLLHHHLHGLAVAEFDDVESLLRGIKFHTIDVVAGHLKGAILCCNAGDAGCACFKVNLISVND